MRHACVLLPLLLYDSEMSMFSIFHAFMCALDETMPTSLALQVHTVMNYGQFFAASMDCYEVAPICMHAWPRSGNFFSYIFNHFLFNFINFLIRIRS